MSLRAKSHTDLRSSGSSDDGLGKSLTMSAVRFGNGTTESKDGVRLLSRPARRPLRVVRPVSAGVSSNASFLHINHLQGELVRKRKECEDLRKENKFLSDEIRLERITMRSENELAMRNLRSVNQELQAQVKDLKQRLCLSQQRAELCSQAADEAEARRGEADKGLVLAEARIVAGRRETEDAQEQGTRLTGRVEELRKECSDLQLALVRTEKNLFDVQLKLERETADKQALLRENENLQEDRDALRHKLRKITDENHQLRESVAEWQRRATASREASERAERGREEAEAERRLTERERRNWADECRDWKDKHGILDSAFRAQEHMKAMRRDKSCQANIKSYFLCMTESDQRVKILKNQDGTMKNFTEGDPVYISMTPESNPEELERSSSRPTSRVSAPLTARDFGPGHFDELLPFEGKCPDSATAHRKSRKLVEYFWIPTDQD
ncbi:paramyosin [Corythoichthys intestinalis]|uniref:paramyosin n=1 Tax=Corythoichthys intestinalis TaxID=161448 RepID=UPI0025A68774|nr:paramyosin [Corythoichthys intestinalis]